MVDLGAELHGVGEGERAESFSIFSRNLDFAWVKRILESTGSATVRRRKLPAEFVAWLVIGMALLRDRSIEEVVHHLDLVLPEARRSARQRATVSSSAVAQARTRLGPLPIQALFVDTAAHWATPSADALRWRDLAVYGVDGTTLRTHDTDENEREFGRPNSGRSPGAYPQLRLIAVMVLRSRLLADVALGPYTSNEQRIAAELWPRLPERSLTVMDRGFINYAVFHQIATHGTDRHWLVRAKSNLKWTVVRSLGHGDDLVQLPIHRKLRKQTTDLPATISARAITYQRPGFRPQVLLTSLLDPEAYPAAEIAVLYHERWELEIGFDEIKTHSFDGAITLRSKSPDRVRQELWGLAIAYNLVRLEIEHVARKLDVDPLRISYRHALMLIRNFLVSAWFARPGVLPKRLDTLHREVALLLLPKRRNRKYPRVVKIKMSNYPKKPPKPSLTNTKKA